MDLSVGGMHFLWRDGGQAPGPDKKRKNCLYSLLRRVPAGAGNLFVPGGIYLIAGSGTR